MAETKTGTVCEPMHYRWIPPRIRIIFDERQDGLDEEDGPPRPWQLDGYDPVERKCSDLMLNFPSHAEAVAAIPAFCEDLIIEANSRG